MHVWVIALLLYSLTISQVESRCSYFRERDDFSDLCKQWFEEAMEYHDRKKPLMKCILLIDKQCPNMMDIDITTTRKYYREISNSQEIWATEVKASLKSQPVPSLRYYKEQKKPVCWDDEGQFSDCIHWWTVAKTRHAKSKYKKRCIERILTHCSNMISKLPDETVSSDPRGRECDKTKIITYQNNKGEKASYEEHASF